MPEGDHEEVTAAPDVAPETDSEDSKDEETTDTDHDSESSESCCSHCQATREKVDDHHNRIEGAEKHIGDIGGVLDRLTNHLESQSSTQQPPKPAPKVKDNAPSGGHFLAKKWGGNKK